MAHSKARPATDELLRLLRKVPQASNRRLERSVLAYMTIRSCWSSCSARGYFQVTPSPLISRAFWSKKLKKRGEEWKMEVIERPQQSIGKALSEYTPGRLIVINKETYRSGGVVANTLPDVENRAEGLFASRRTLAHCERCSFVADLDEEATSGRCPICESDLKRSYMVVPEVFLPEDGRALKEDDRDQEITYATAAQFPVPVGKDDLPGLTSIGENLSFAVTADRKLVTVNKGQEGQDGRTGFWICDHCGKASIDEPPQIAHDRPYQIEFAFGKPKPSRQCTGTGNFERVFLGQVFSTDLLLLRIDLRAPLVNNTTDPLQLRILEDALYSVAEALRLIGQPPSPDRP